MPYGIEKLGEYGFVFLKQFSRYVSIALMCIIDRVDCQSYKFIALSRV